MNSQFPLSVAAGVFRSRRFQSAHPEVGAPQTGLGAFRRTTIWLGAAKTLGAKLRTQVGTSRSPQRPFLHAPSDAFKGPGRARCFAPQKWA